MGYYLLLAFAAHEVFLAYYRIKAKVAQNTASAALRVAGPVFVWALCALSVIHWGIRYYALAAVLSLPAMAGILHLARRRGEKPQCNPAHTIKRATAMIVLLSAAFLPAIVFPEYKSLPVTGEYSVMNSVRYMTDTGRIESYGGKANPRALTVEFWYPDQEAGSYPLIVFSHGSFGIRSSNETLYRELASNGYVVCSIDHTYQCFYTSLQDGKMVWMDNSFAKEVMDEDAKTDPQKSLASYRRWMDVRVADMDFVLTTILSKAEEENADAVYGLINSEKVGVIGHSLGGSAALGIGRQRSGIGAVVALEAPFLCDIIAVRDGGFVFDESEYPVPLLNVYSDSSFDKLSEWPQYASNARLLLGEDKDSYNLHIAGTGHLSLTDLSLSSPLLTRILNGHSSSLRAQECLIAVNQACLSFFDRCLKGYS